MFYNDKITKKAVAKLVKANILISTKGKNISCSGGSNNPKYSNESGWIYAVTLHGKLYQIGNDVWDFVMGRILEWDSYNVEKFSKGINRDLNKILNEKEKRVYIESKLQKEWQELKEFYKVNEYSWEYQGDIEIHKMHLNSFVQLNFYWLCARFYIYVYQHEFTRLHTELKLPTADDLGLKDIVEFDKLLFLQYHFLLNKIALVYHNKIKSLENFVSTIEPVNLSNRNIKADKSKTLAQLLSGSNSEKIVASIKVNYKNIKGKRLKLLFLALQELELLPLTGAAANFHKCCQLEFQWDIASYSAMNDYKYNKSVDFVEKESFKHHIQTLMKTE
jgi:hypothetical protein